MERIKITYKSGEVRYIMQTIYQKTWRLTDKIGNATRFKNNSQALSFLDNAEVLLQFCLMAGTSKFNEIEKIEFENVN